MVSKLEQLTPRKSPHAAHHGGFLRHLLEMVAAMLVGMVAAIPVLWALFAALGVHTADEASAKYPEVVCLVVAGGMVTTMVAWMRHRGHSWQLCAEMATAMVVPLAPIFALLWAGVLPGGSACGLYCVAMIPAMVAAMLIRRDEYGGRPMLTPLHA